MVGSVPVNGTKSTATAMLLVVVVVVDSHELRKLLASVDDIAAGAYSLNFCVLPLQRNFKSPPLPRIKNACTFCDKIDNSSGVTCRIGNNQRASSFELEAYGNLDKYLILSKL